MKQLKIVRALLVLLIALPIWLYLLYAILSAIDASDLVWFLFWVYIPVSALTTFIGNLIED